jgi:hypothetical protein
LILGYVRPRRREDQILSLRLERDGVPAAIVDHHDVLLFWLADEMLGGLMAEVNALLLHALGQRFPFRKFEENAEMSDR